jgi:2-polyprenyl-3-methyl-5-hydroxy-6-metoxy-1,4-benzoquinol methylase
MTEECVRKLDTEALNLFAKKGCEGGPGVPQVGEANGVKVRRIMQITRDLARRPFPELRILDLGCGEGVYAIEAGLRGAEVLALDARTQRMDQGAGCAARHGLTAVRFVQGDVRRVSREALGSFDVVYLLGLLYHLDAPDVFSVLQNVCGLCTGMLVIDTLISLTPETQVEWQGQVYQGRMYREHGDEDAEEVRRTRVLRSIDNTFSFRFTKESLLRALRDVGFTSAYECHVPREPDKAEDRITVVAQKGMPVLLSTYPWVNHKSEDEIERVLQTSGPARPPVESGKGDL